MLPPWRRKNEQLSTEGHIKVWAMEIAGHELHLLDSQPIFGLSSKTRCTPATCNVRAGVVPLAFSQVLMLLSHLLRLSLAELWYHLSGATRLWHWCSGFPKTLQRQYHDLLHCFRLAMEAMDHLQVFGPVRQRKLLMLTPLTRILKMLKMVLVILI